MCTSPRPCDSLTPESLHNSGNLAVLVNRGRVIVSVQKERLHALSQQNTSDMDWLDGCDIRHGFPGMLRFGNTGGSSIRAGCYGRSS